MTSTTCMITWDFGENPKKVLSTVVGFLCFIAIRMVSPQIPTVVPPVCPWPPGIPRQCHSPPRPAESSVAPWTTRSPWSGGWWMVRSSLDNKKFQLLKRTQLSPKSHLKVRPLKWSFTLQKSSIFWDQNDQNPSAWGGSCPWPGHG